MPQVEITADLSGMGKFIVDGTDISSAVTGVDIHIRPGKPTIVTFHTFAELLASVDTEVQVAIRNLEGERNERDPGPTSHTHSREESSQTKGTGSRASGESAQG